MDTTIGAVRRRWTASAMLVGVLAGSACGSGSSTSDPPTTVAPTTSSAGAADDVVEEAEDEVGEPAPADGSVLFDFSAESSTDGWTNQDDPVMGGVSQSSAAWRDGALVFAGEVSLENNGGFASVRSPSDPLLGEAAAGMRALVLDGTGDGRTYVVQLRTDDALSIQRVETEAGVARSYELPASGFTAVNFRLEALVDPPAFDPSSLTQVALYATDGQAGPFEMAITRITALR